MKFAIRPISQRNSQWKDKLLGTSTVSTIGNYGCLLTCCAMLCRYFGKDTDPERLNEEMKKVKGFYQGSYWLWGKLTEVYPDITFDWNVYNDGQCADIPAPLELVDKLLDDQTPVIVKVDFSPTAGVQDHWVLIIGKENDSYLINDPWTGETYFFQAKYGDPVTGIYQICAYKGPVDNKFRLFQGGVEVKAYDENPDDIISDLQKNNQALNDTLATKALEVNECRTHLETQEADNQDLLQQIREAREQKDHYFRQLAVANIEIKDLADKVDVLDVKNKGLAEALEASQGQTLSQFSTRKLLVEVINRIFGKGGEEK